MFQFYQNNSQLLFHVIVSPWGAGAFSRVFTKTLARQCRAFSRALTIEKLKAPLFPGPGGARDANDWCISYPLRVIMRVQCIDIEQNLSKMTRGSTMISVISKPVL